MSQGVEVALNAGASCATRNGMHAVKTIRVSIDGGVAEVRCVSRRFSRVLRPCLRLSAEEMDRLASEWIASRGGSEGMRRHLAREGLGRIVKTAAEVADAIGVGPIDNS